MVQLSQLYVTTGKTIALTILTFVCKVMSLLFNSLSRVVNPLEYSNWSLWLMTQPLGWYLVNFRDVPRQQELSSRPLFDQQENRGRPWSRKHNLVSCLRSHGPGSTEPLPGALRVPGSPSPDKGSKAGKPDASSTMGHCFRCLAHNASFFLPITL